MSYEAGGSSRNKLRTFLSVLLVLATAALLITLSLAQVTEEAPAKRSIARSVAILSEVDAFLDDNLEELRREAEASDQGTVELVGFPVQVTLSSHELLNESDATIRALALARAADQVHEQGLPAFGGASSASSALSIERVLEAGIRGVRSGPHEVYFTMAAVSAGITLILAVGILLVSPLHRGLIRVGVSVVAGALPIVLVAALLMLAFDIGSDGLEDYLASEVLRLAEVAIWAPLRNGLIFLGAAAGFLILGLILTPRSGVAGSTTALA